jgi:hypothetical protein
MKVAISIAIFLSISSIASLSEIIFKWKGFIFDAIEFYRHWIVQPLRNFASFFGLTYYSKAEVDSMIIYSMITATSLRIIGLKNKIHLFCMPLLISGVILSGIYGSIPESFDYIINGIYLFLYSTLGVLFYIKSRAEFIKGYGPILAAIAIVLMLGAINAGLLKTQ